MAPVFGDENGNKAMVEETHQVFAPKLRGKFPLLFTKLFSMLCLFLGCLAATMGILMTITCKREVAMNFNPYGLGVWSGLPIWLSGWLALMSLDAPTNNRVLATLICTWTSGAVAIGGCVMAVFDHLAAGLGPTNYYLSLVMAVTLGLSVVPLMGLAIISSVSFCCSQKTININYPHSAMQQPIQQVLLPSTNQSLGVIKEEHDPANNTTMITTAGAVNMVHQQGVGSGAGGNTLPRPGGFSRYLSGRWSEGTSPSRQVSVLNLQGGPVGSSSDMLEQQQQPITAYGFPNAETRGQFGVQSQQSAGAKNAAAAGQQPVLNQQQKEALVKKALKNDKVKKGLFAGLMASFKKGAEAAGVEQPDLGPAGDAAMEKGMEVAEEKLEEEFNKAIDKAISNHETNDAAMY